MADHAQIMLVRQLIADTGDPQILPHDHLDALLTLEGGSVRLAAAQALEVIAADRTLVQSVIRTQDLQTDGAKVADSLRALAASLRKRARELGEDPAGEGEDFFDVIDTLPGRTYPEHTNRLVTGL